ncbi:AraC family transcriptional regulator [Pedobacter heparinus]|uniref:AraC family transcriptional regulator n=1 Tax=Pedobacter heparinus TaxID=984 RepID=UPI00292D3782|nr:AraC family transcriptional regulator [Pedobacter heparinus]
MASTSQQHIEIENDIKDSFYIQFYQNKKYAETLPQRLAYHRMILVQSGKGKIKIDERVFELSPATLFLIAKGQVIHFQQSASFRGFELGFGDCFWEKTPQSANNCKAVLFNNAAANQSLLLTAANEQELNFLFQCLLTESAKDVYINQLDVMAAYLKIIMIKTANVNDSLLNALENYENTIYRQFLNLITEHHQSSHEVKDYASLLGVTVRKLTELSRRYGGRGAKESINDHLIAEAKRYLQFSATPIKTIAFALNFGSADQFSHFFKKNTQISPKAYRTHFIGIGNK